MKRVDTTGVCKILGGFTSDISALYLQEWNDLVSNWTLTEKTIKTFFNEGIGTSFSSLSA